jgi:hypothetical protein
MMELQELQPFLQGRYVLACAEATSFSWKTREPGYFVWPIANKRKKKQHERLAHSTISGSVNISWLFTYYCLFYIELPDVKYKAREEMPGLNFFGWVSFKLQS